MKDFKDFIFASAPHRAQADTGAPSPRHARSSLLRLLRNVGGALLRRPYRWREQHELSGCDSIVAILEVLVPAVVQVGVAAASGGGGSVHSLEDDQEINLRRSISK